MKATQKDMDFSPSQHILSEDQLFEHFIGMQCPDCGLVIDANQLRTLPVRCDRCNRILIFEGEKNIC